MTTKTFLWWVEDRQNFRSFQAHGIHVVPNHFYQPVPDTRELDDGFFAKKDDLTGIAMHDEAQCTLLEELIRTYKAEYRAFAFHAAKRLEDFYWANASFECLDAVMLYGMVRHLKPSRMIEIGCGISTRLTLAALAKNRQEGHAGSLRCIEPYPNPVVRDILSRHMELCTQPVQKAPFEWFTELHEGDMIFIDTSHVLKYNSDVQFYFERLLPHVPAGVYVHFHDIFLPEEYPREWVMDELRFYNEQYILRAFLTFNEVFRVVLAGRYLQLKYPELVRQALDFYPAPLVKASSFWIQRMR